MEPEVRKSDAEWRRELTPEVYHVTREGGTEPPFSGKYHDAKTAGMYVCSNCGADLFSPQTKFDSGTGWPSFTAPAQADRVELRRDLSHGMIRTEVRCRRCGAHLGHLFEDGPADKGGKRYCINSLSLGQKPE